MSAKGRKDSDGSSASKRPVPAFLSKLYTIVETTAPLCNWGADGETFVITDSVTFAKEVLAKYVVDAARFPQCLPRGCLGGVCWGDAQGLWRGGT